MMSSKELERNWCDTTEQLIKISDPFADIPKPSRFRRHATSTLRIVCIIQLLCGMATTCFPFLWAYANIGRLYFVGSTVMCGTIFWVAGILGLAAHQWPAHSGTWEITFMSSLAAAVGANYLLVADIISEFSGSWTDLGHGAGFPAGVSFYLPFANPPRKDFIQEVMTGRAMTRLCVGFTSVVELIAAMIAASLAANRTPIRPFSL